jgi:hypothetical protein
MAEQFATDACDSGRGYSSDLITRKTIRRHRQQQDSNQHHLVPRAAIACPMQSSVSCGVNRGLDNSKVLGYIFARQNRVHIFQ